jgi:segregation and condensation protein A
MNPSAYEHRSQAFTGPLDKLLELIEEQELDITDISLAQVTDDFLKYLESLRIQANAAQTPAEAVITLRLLADFILIASRLVFIKSKSLLPDLTLTEEEEGDIRDLEGRLRILRELKPAMKELGALYSAGNHAWSRPYFLNAVSAVSGEASVAVFYPSPSLTDAALVGALTNLFSAFERLVMENETIREKVVSLEAKIKEIILRIREITETSFSRLTDAATRGEMIIAFLAVLHLAREQIISLEQEAHFSDILIKKAEAPSQNHEADTRRG